MGEKGDRWVQFYSALTSPTQTSLRKRKSCLLNFLLGSPKCKSCASEGLGWGSLGGQRAARKEEGRFRPIAHEVSCRPRTPCVPHLSPTTTSSGFSIGSSSLCSLTDPSIRCEGYPVPTEAPMHQALFSFFLPSPCSLSECVCLCLAFLHLPHQPRRP